MIHEDTDNSQVELHPELRDYSSWQHPFRAATIYMHVSPMTKLPAHALRSFLSDNSSEVGGILLARSFQGRLSHRPVILDVEFVESTGVLYNTSAADALRLKTALSRPALKADDANRLLSEPYPRGIVS